MKKTILPIVLGYAAIIMISGCQMSNNELNGSTDINSDVLSENRNEDNPIIMGSTSDKIHFSAESESNNSQTNATTSSNTESNETNFLPINNDKNNPSDSNSKPGNDALEAGEVEIIDELLELKSDGQAHGEIEAGMKIDYRKATLTEGSCVTFNVDCEQKLTNIKIALTDLKTGKYMEDHIIGKGELFFEADTDGEYVVTIENCSDRGTYFTIGYRINEKTNTI
ncbi:MAG: hypothetical protein HDT44_02745 [Ruminococcaceae bacterium]|nr:hypothetical protein [Oscillospiraceae bacterium]